MMYVICTDCEAICKLGLKAKILTHIRCHMDDARIAVETGVDGVDVVIGTSSFLREFSHGKDMAYITKTAIEVIEFVKSKGASAIDGGLELVLMPVILVQASKSDSLPKIPSGPILSTFSPFTRPSTRLVSTESVLLIQLVARTLVRSTTSFVHSVES